MKSVRLIVVLSALLAVTVLATDARGQGASGHGIPDPITTSELLRYADRLVLSDEQRQALQPFHDEYRERFRQLREGEIDRYIERMQATGRAMPGQDEWERSQRDRDRILSQIKTIDDALFTNLESILTDEQRERVLRVRMARQRARALPATQFMMSRSQIVDLSELVLDLDLSLSDRERIDPWLFDYERRLTRMIEELPGLITDSWVEFYRRSEEMRREMEEQRGDPEAAAQRGQRMMEVMQGAWAAPQEQAAKIRTTGRTAMFDISAQLSDGAARELRNAFIRRSYMTASHHLRTTIEEVFEQLRASEELDLEQLEIISTLAAQTRQRLEGIMREALAAVEEHEATNSMFRMDMDAMREHHEQLAAIGERIRDVERQAVEELLAQLPEEVAAQVPQSLVQRAQSPAPSRRTVTDEGESRRQYLRMQAGATLPRAIPATEVAQIARELELDDEQREALHEMHEGYAEKVAEASRPFRHDAAASGDDSGLETAEQAIEARSRAFTQIERADNEFFHALIAAFPDRTTEIERFRLARERQRYTSGRSFGMVQRMMNTDAAVDLTQVARSSQIDLYGSPEAEPILSEYERELTRLLRDRYEAMLEADDAQLHSMLRAMRAEGRREAFSEDAAEQMRRRREMEGRLDAVEGSIRELTQRTLDNLGSILPEASSAALLAGYRERAMPRVYSDGSAMAGRLSQVLRMDDLTSSQRDRIAELAAEYQAAYTQLTERMREVHEEREEAQRETREAQRVGGPQRASVETRRLWEEFEKLRYERQELNSRTILNLRGILNEDQLARLGPMPDASRPGGRRFSR